MGHVVKTPAGVFRANWRDAAGRQKAKTFKTKKEANTFLAETESALSRGGYVDPHAGRVKFGDYAEQWLESHTLGVRAAERVRSVMRTHVLSRWSNTPIGKIDHMAVQRWVRDLGDQLAPATVAKCFGVFAQVIRSAIRSRLIAHDPTDGVAKPSTYQQRSELSTISREMFFGRLLPAVPPEHRALVCLAASTGLRWGECVGLAWRAVDLDMGRLRVVQVAVESAAAVTIKPTPKTRAGVRTVPMPSFLVDVLRSHREIVGPDDELVFATRTGSPLRRSNFRRQIWRPALVRAGLLGKVDDLGPSWSSASGADPTEEFQTEREAVAYVAENASGGLRFHDLRHSYATWLVSDGVPVNVVQRVMGHQHASTTLNLYTHAPDDYDQRVREVLDR